MEVVVPTPATDFNFDSTSSSPYITAPSTPKIFAPDFYYFSAPASPTRSNSLPLHYNNEVDDDDDDGDNFAFNFSGQLHPPDITTAAEDLFEQGRIRPLKPPPLQNPYKTSTASSSSASPKQVIRKALSPCRRNINLDQKPSTGAGTSTSASSSFSSLSSYFKVGSKRWRFKDLLLFRSASEGRAAEKDPLRKYSLLTKRGTGGCGEDVRNASFRSTDSTGSSRRAQAGAVSAHELHYTMNRAVSEELKRKTFLPYRQGLLGCLGFNPSAQGGLAKGFDSFGRV